MAIDKIWVLAEVADGKPITASLELISHAKSLAGTVEAVAYGDETAAIAATLGEYGATSVHDVGDLGGALPGAPGGRSHRRRHRGRQRAGRHPLPPTTVGTLPGACRPRSTSPSSPMWWVWWPATVASSPNTPSSVAPRRPPPDSPVTVRACSSSGPSRSRRKCQAAVPPRW